MMPGAFHLFQGVPPGGLWAALQADAGGRAAPGSAAASAIPSPAGRAQGSAGARLLTGAGGAALRIPHAIPAHSRQVPDVVYS
ncbi:MAG: hypothetical protein N2050_05620 [Flavobacteriales bacterium]|nr:hypothetical protein [Flavobacteriales bacterium]MCX7650014.1 hypothetical protein [Flavobacteriales bacterium]MDW8432005.1 hypothetical protein [Flavobacteriales bacterium]